MLLGVAQLRTCLRALRTVQVQGREGFPVKYSSVYQCAYTVAKEEGVASFWRGSMCSFMKVLPHTMLSVASVLAP